MSIIFINQLQNISIYLWHQNCNISGHQFIRSQNQLSLFTVAIHRITLYHQKNSKPTNIRFRFLTREKIAEGVMHQINFTGKKGLDPFTFNEHYQQMTRLREFNRIKIIEPWKYFGYDINLRVSSML